MEPVKDVKYAAGATWGQAVAPQEEYDKKRMALANGLIGGLLNGAIKPSSTTAMQG